MKVPFFQKEFVFVFRLEGLIPTTRHILDLLGQRSIRVSDLHLNAVNAAEGRLLLHCHLEKDRVPRTLSLFRKLPGVLGIEYMEAVAAIP